MLVINKSSGCFFLVIRGVVNRYYTQSSQDHIELTVKCDYIRPLCQNSATHYKQSFLWKSPQNCTCTQLKIGSEILVVGFYSGRTYVIDTRSRSMPWNTHLAKHLQSYQKKVNHNHTRSCY